MTNYCFESNSEKNRVALLVVFLGVFGSYYFYRKNYVLGIAAIFTLNFWLIGWIVNLIQVFRTPVDRELSIEYKRQAIEKEKMERQVIGQNRAKVMSDYIMWDKYENIVAINKRNGKILFTTKSYIEQQISKPVELNISHLEYLITDILDIKVQSETSRKVTTTVNNGRVTTSGTSMVSRALVGSLLLGPAGMIIGAATAKKNQGKSTSSSNIVESTLYSLLIFIRSEEPVVFATSYNQAVVENLQLQIKDFISQNSNAQ